MPAMTSNRPLRIALLSNAIFSAVCGLLMLLWPGSVGNLLGVEVSFVLRLVGLGLLLFAADLIHQVGRSRLATWRVLYASIADGLWVVISLLGLGLFPELFSSLGKVVLLLIAVIVATFGGWQIWGIDRYYRQSQSSLHRHCLVVRTEAPAAAIWAVIEQMGDIQRYMPSLLKSEILDHHPPGVGAVRHCQDRSGKSWMEECVDFVPGRSLTMRFVTEAADFPFPATTMLGGWQVLAVGEASEVTVWWELAPKPRFLAPILLTLLAVRSDRDFVQVIRRMADAALGREYSKADLIMGSC
jgi:Polyketide cyclase / dehydrase and lipid transport